VLIRVHAHFCARYPAERPCADPRASTFHVKRSPVGGGIRHNASHHMAAFTSKLWLLRRSHGHILCRFLADRGSRHVIVIRINKDKPAVDSCDWRRGVGCATSSSRDLDLCPFGAAAQRLPGSFRVSPLAFASPMPNKRPRVAHASLAARACHAACDIWT